MTGQTNATGSPSTSQTYGINDAQSIAELAMLSSLRAGRPARLVGAKRDVGRHADDLREHTRIGIEPGMQESRVVGDQHCRLLAG